MALPNPMIGWPIRFAATAFILRVTANAIAENLNFPIAGGLSLTQDYYMSGDGQADDLVTMLAATIQGHTQIVTCVGTLTAGFRVRMDASSTFSINWSHVSTTLDELVFGWTNADTSTGNPQDSPNLPHGIWRPQRPIAFDGRDRQPIVGGLTAALSGRIRVADYGTPLKERDVSWIYLPQERILTEYAVATEPTGAFEDAWQRSIRFGRTLRLYADETVISPSSYTTYRTRGLSDPLSRNEQYPVYWDTKLMLRRAA